LPPHPGSKVKPQIELGVVRLEHPSKEFTGGLRTRTIDCAQTSKNGSIADHQSGHGQPIRCGKRQVPRRERRICRLPTRLVSPSLCRLIQGDTSPGKVANGDSTRTPEVRSTTKNLEKRRAERKVGRI